MSVQRRIAMRLLFGLASCSNPASQVAKLVPQAAPDQLFRTKEPPQASRTPYRGPKVRHSQLKNGLTVATVQVPRSSATTVCLATAAGSAYDEDGQRGSAAVIAKSFQRTNVVVQLGADSLFQCSTAAGDPAHDIKVLSAQLRRPDFHREATAQSDGLRSLKPQLDRSPFLMTLYDKHPYARPNDLSTAQPRIVDSSTLYDFHRRWMRPERTAAIFVGDVQFESAHALVEATLGDWRVESPLADDPVARETLSTPFTRFIVGDEDTPIRIWFGRLLHAREPKELPSTLIFKSILQERLRHSLPASVETQIDIAMRRGPGFFYLGATVDDPALTLATLQQIEATLAGFANEPVTPTELVRAKNRYLDLLGVPFQSSRKTAEMIGTLFVSRMPMTFFESLTNEIEELDPDAMQEMIESNYQLMSLSVVVNGPSTVHEAFRSFSLQRKPDQRATELRGK